MTMSYDTLVKNFNDLASRLTTVESLLQNNDVNTGASDPGTDVNGEQIAPEQSADTTFNFPGYNSQNTDGQQQVLLDGLQSQIDSLNLAMNQAQLLISGGTNDLNQANAKDANQVVGDDGANGNGITIPSSIANTISTIAGKYANFFKKTNAGNGVFSIPAGVTEVTIVTVGGGGDGGSGGSILTPSFTLFGGGGGAGGFYLCRIPVSPGSSIAYTVGAAGAASSFAYGAMTVTCNGGSTGGNSFSLGSAWDNGTPGIGGSVSSTAIFGGYGQPGETGQLGVIIGGIFTLSGGTYFASRFDMTGANGGRGWTIINTSNCGAGGAGGQGVGGGGGSPGAILILY